MNTKTGKKPIGRPTIYKPEYCQALLDYMTQEPFEDHAVIHTNTKGETWTELKRVPAKIRFLEDFAYEIVHTTPQTLIEWAQKFPRFGEAYSRARHMQKAHLLQCGFAGVSDSQMTKFAAVNLTDCRDKADIEHSGTVNVKAVDYANAESAGFNPDGSRKPGH